MRYLGGIQGEKNLRGDVAWFGECFDTYGFTLWVMERKRDGAFLGFCGLDRLEHDVPDHLLGRIEVGWRLREDTWGEG
jgi:RimJ/RimL family protein N-acetyltransferase